MLHCNIKKKMVGVAAMRQNASRRGWRTKMLSIGQYDSPFVRRVAVALTLYGVAFDHAAWSGFGDVDKIAL